MAKNTSERHVAVFTFPFASHPLPLFNLVLKLANAIPQVQFSFFSSSKANQSLLLPTVQKAAVDHIMMIPSNLKTYDFSIEDNNVALFIQGLHGDLKRCMEVAEADTARSITCLVADTFLSFAVGKLAEEFNFPWVSFFVPSPWSLSADIQMDLIRQFYNNKKIPDLDNTLEAIPGLSVFRFRDLPDHILRNPDSIGYEVSMIQKMAPALPKASAVVLNSFQEVIPELLTKDLESKFQRLLYAGFLSINSMPPQPKLPTTTDTTGCLPWLDGQKPFSVAYISFGSVATLPKEELEGLAEALEATGVLYLWSLKDNLKDELPDGFLQRTSSQGKVVPWAPQTQVLSHESVGVHVTHYGYNSVCESIISGVPMIGRSWWTDNHMNARMVEEVWGIGLRVDGGVITKTGMVKCLKLIFENQEGKKIRENINALKEIVSKAAGPDGSAAKDFKTLVQIVSEV